MAEETKDPRAVELGRRGGLARRSRQTPEERKTIARLGGIARATKAAVRREQESLLPTNVTELVQVTYEITPWKALRGVKAEDAQRYIDQHWTPRLIQFFEQLMQAYTRGGNLDAALNVAMTMAGMTSTLSPGPLAQAGREGTRQVRLRRTRSVALDGRTAVCAPRQAAFGTGCDGTGAFGDSGRGPYDLDDGRAAPFENIGVSNSRSPAGRD
jgi:hypothetical protein